MSRDAVYNIPENALARISHYEAGDARRAETYSCRPVSTTIKPNEVVARLSRAFAVKVVRKAGLVRKLAPLQF
jgi:hypothetical protein